MLGLVMLATIVGWGCQSALAQSTGTTSPIASPVAQHTFRVGPFQVELTKASWLTSGLASLECLAPPQARGIFVLLELQVTNETLHPVGPPVPLVDAANPLLALRLRDSRGRIFKTDANAMEYLSFAYNYPDLLQPSLTYPAGLIYDVSPDATDLTLLIGTAAIVLPMPHSAYGQA